MITLGKEQPLGLEVQEVFNPSTVQMMLNAQQNYVNAMRDDYLRGIQNFKDFQKQYGDFYSLIPKDNENWYNMIHKPINDLLSKYGYDMLRSPEGRAMIENATNNVNKALAGRLKAGAKVADEYLKNAAALQTKGKFNQDFENYQLQQLGMKPLNEWDSLKDGLWGRRSPTEWKTLTEISDPVYEGMKGEDKGVKDGYRYFGVDDNDLLKVAGDRAQYLKNDPLGGYYYNKSLQHVKEQNPNMSDDQLKDLADQDFIQAVAHSQDKRKFMKSDADEYALTKFKTNEAIREHTANAATDYDYDLKLAKGGNGKGQKEKYDIFSDAKQNGSGAQGYDPTYTNDYRINVMPGHNIKSFYEKGNFSSYQIPAEELDKVLYMNKSIYSKSAPVKLNGLKIKSGQTYYFTPGGQLHAKTDKNKKTRYFITGQLVTKQLMKNDNGDIMQDKDGNPIYKTLPVLVNGKEPKYQMEVTQNTHAYKSDNTVE